MDGFLQTIRNLGTIRLLAMAGVAVGLLVFFVFLATELNKADMDLLYSDLNSRDSAKIVAKLESMGVPYKLTEKGGQIMVPTDGVAGLRMTMAEEGLPDGGSVGYDIFDRSETLGTTSFVQNINLLRALEGELARSIKSIQHVKDARVHLVLPKRELFSRRTREPSASVVLRTGGNTRLPKPQILAIQHLMAAAVPGLEPSRISIVDHRGRLLARKGAKDKDTAVLATDNEEFRRNKELQLIGVIEELVEQTVGVGKVRARVALEMDFDQVVTNSETYDPDGQVVRSTQSVEENAKSNESDDTKSVTVANNLPDSAATGGGNDSASQSARTEETVNYEISKTIRNHIRESGSTRRLSVAVLVDGIYTTDAKGEQVYKPRTKEELEQIGALVRSAIGFNKERGDDLEVVNMRFITAANTEFGEASALLGLTKADYFRIAEMFVLAIVGILVILLVVRPLVARTLESLPTAIDPATEQPAAYRGPERGRAARTGRPGRDGRRKGRPIGR